jgi:hypothetical protein
MKRVVTGFGACLMLLSACSAVREVDLPPLVSPTPTGVRSLPAGSARIAIVSPKDGSSVAGLDVEVRVEVRGFKLVQGKDDQARLGEGRLMFYSGDSYDPPTARDRRATAGGSGSFVASGSTKPAYVWRGVEPGQQMFAVQLVTTDGAPLYPPRTASVTVMVKG